MRNNGEKRLQRVVATVCATLFAVFTFLFVGVYQAPLLEAFYNEVATGKLNYNPWLVGGVVSLVLTTLALWLNRFAKLRREWTALAYLPSAFGSVLLWGRSLRKRQSSWADLFWCYWALKFCWNI